MMTPKRERRLRALMEVGKDGVFCGLHVVMHSSVLQHAICSQEFSRQHLLIAFRTS